MDTMKNVFCFLNSLVLFWKIFEKWAHSKCYWGFNSWKNSFRK